MKFILTISNWIKDWEIVKKISKIADEYGFWGLGMPDHYLWTEGRDHTLETWIALTHLASITKNIHVGTIVTPVALRPPTILAKMVSTVDNISNGRTFLGVGAGWSQREFETYSTWSEPKIRVERTEEAIKLVKKMWKDSKIDFEGTYYNVKAGILEPKPIQNPHPPILFGGFGTKMLKLAGKYGDIAFIPPWRYENFDQGRQIVSESAKKYSNENIKYAYGSPVDKEKRYAPIDFELDAYYKGVEKATEYDCDYFVLSLPEKEIISTMVTFAKEIIPVFRKN